MSRFGILLCCLIFSFGCLWQEDQGTRVGTPTSDPADFEVGPPAPATNDPDPSQTPDSSGNAESDPEDSDWTQDFTINGGSRATRSPVLHLDIAAGDAITDIKISFSDNCEGGQFEPVRNTADLQSPLSNQRINVSILFSDFEHIPRECVVRSILHDDQGPKIIFTQYPTARLEEGSTAAISYVIEDASPVVSASCSLNGVVKPCPTTGSDVAISKQPEGHYVFQVSAQDELGNTSQSEVKWEVVSLTRLLTQDIRVNDLRKVDILVVIDNSGSMTYEQQSMASRVSNFLSIIEGLDYQIGVTTTDARDVALGDGRLIPIYNSNGQYILDTSTPAPEAQYRLGMTLQRPETGSHSEQGIRATYRALERGQDHSSPGNAQLIREGAQLAVLVISDEDESANTEKNDPENLIKLVHDRYNGQKTFTWHSIITRPNDTACRSTHGAAYGNRYARLSDLTGGIIGSVCELDYASQVSGIATGIRNMLKTLTLQCEPLQQFGIEVSKDGIPYNEPFSISGVNLNFTTELPAGDFSVTYRCLK